MPVDLLKNVQSRFLTRFDADRFRLRHRGSRFAFETVDLDAGNTIIRIAKEMSPYDVYFASMLDPIAWYTAREVSTFLDCSWTGLPDSKIDAVLVALEAFVRRCGGQLDSAFGKDRLVATRSALLEIRKRSSIR